MAGEVKIPIGLNTDTALQDAKKLGEGVKKTLANIDMTQANSKTMTFIKNLTSAYGRMQKLADETERLAKTKLPTEDYVYFSKQLEIAQKQLTKLQQKQEQIESDRATLRAREKSILLDMEKTEAAIETARVSKNQEAMQEASSRLRMLKEEQAKLPGDIQKLDDLWRKVGGRIDEFKPRINDLTAQMEQLVEQNEAFTSGKETDAYKQKENALHLQAQAVNILLMRYAEMNDASTTNVFNSNRETEAIERETRATRELSNARRELSGGRGGVVRGPSRYKNRGISRGPALDTVDEVKFQKDGDTVAMLSRYAQAEDEVAKSTDKADESTKRASASMRSYSSVLSDMGRNILSRVRNALNRLVHAFKQLAGHLHSSHRSHSGLMGNMKHSLSMILRYTLGIRSLFMLIRRIRSYVTEAFKVMAQEIPEVNEAISQLGTSFKQLKAGFGTMLQPLLQALAPILDALIQKVVSLMNAIARFFATLTGQDYIYEATVANYDYAESVKEAESSLASFDKLNTVQRNKDNTLALTKDTVTYKKVNINPEDNWYTKLAKKIAEGWKKADLTDATHSIAEKLASLLDSIKWSDIKKRSKKFAKTLATGINGITLPDENTGKSNLAVSIGHTIAEALQTAIDTFDEFIKDIHWENLGKFIGDAIEALKTRLRDNDSWKNAGRAFGHLFTNLISLGFKLFVEDNILEGLGKDLSDMLNSFLDEGLKVNPKTNRTYFEDLGEAVTTGFINFLEEVEKFIEGSASKLGDALEAFMKGTRLKDLFLTLARVLIKGIFWGIDMLVKGAAGALGINISDSTAAFIAEAIGLGVVASSILKLKDSILGKGGSGGLLGAFRKKDDALDTQKEKLGKEKGAVEKLFGAVGGLTLIGLPLLNMALSNTDSSLDNTTTKFNDLAEAGKVACEDIKTASQDTVTKVPEMFNAMQLKVNPVDTGAYKTFLTETGQTLTTAAEMWNNFYTSVGDMKVPEVELPNSSGGTVGKSDNNTFTLLGWSALQRFSNINLFDKDKNDKNKKNKGGGSGGGGSITKIKTGSNASNKVSMAPYDDLIANSIKTQGEISQKTIQDNSDYFAKVLNTLKSDEAKATFTAMFLDTAASLGNYKTLEDVFASPGATASVWSLLATKGNYDGVNAIVTGEQIFKQMTNGKQVSEDNIIAYFIKSFLPAFNMGSFSSIAVPAFARGAVIPANKPFMAILGDQKSGTNVEAPLATIEKAVANVLANMKIKAEFDVNGDPYRLFKVVQKQARIEYNQTGQNASV